MPGQNLTRDEAAARAGLVTATSYDVALDPSGAADPARKTFRSTTIFRFTLEA